MSNVHACHRLLHATVFTGIPNGNAHHMGDRAMLVLNFPFFMRKWGSFGSYTTVPDSSAATCLMGSDTAVVLAGNVLAYTACNCYQQ